MKALKALKFAKPFFKGGRKLARFTVKNSNWILSLITLFGMGAAVGTAVDATVKAVKLCEEKQVHGTKEVIKTVWKLYIPTAGFIIVATTSVLGNAHINAKRIATVTGLWAASQTDAKLFHDKAQEILGEKKTKDVEAEAERQKVLLNPPPAEDEIIQTGHGNDLFMFGWTGKYFRASPEYIELVFDKWNQEIQGDMDGTAYVHRIIDMLDMPACDSGDAYFDMVRLQTEGYKEIRPNITACQWMVVNGKREMVSTLRFTPQPTGL